MKCFFHRADLDGQCSGAIIYQYTNAMCEMIGINYADAFPWDSIKKGETVYMADFSLPREEMIQLDAMSYLVWLDHHDTAIQEMSGLELDGIQRNGIGACALVWEFIHKTELPEAVKLLAKYDVWDHTNPKTLPFQYAMGLEYTWIDAVIWDSVFESNSHWILKMVNIGKIVQKRVNKDNKSYIKAFGFPTTFAGYSAIAVNRGMCNSLIFDSIEEDYELMITFAFKGGHWNFSLYTQQEYVHCGELAKEYGGGGHRQAAGFQLDYIPSEITGGQV